MALVVRVKESANTSAIVAATTPPTMFVGIMSIFLYLRVRVKVTPIIIEVINA